MNQFTQVMVCVDGEPWCMHDPICTEIIHFPVPCFGEVWTFDVSYGVLRVLVQQYGMTMEAAADVVIQRVRDDLAARSN
jgi:hypothetical protein